MLRICALFAITLASLAAPTIGRAQPVPNTGVNSLVGIWSFDGRTACRSGPAWVLAADGTYSEVVLPALRPRAQGRWNERNGTIFYSLAQPGELPRTATPLSKRMKIIERSTDRLVAIGGRRVRHVMHRCK